MEYYTSYSRNTEKYLLQGIITCSGFLTLFFLFISLKLDQNFSISKWWILSPFGLATFTLIILWSIFLYNEPNIFERDIHIFVLFVFYVMAGLLLVFISIIKAFSIYESQTENPSYKGVFIPLIFLSIYPIIGTIFVCIIRHSSYFSRTDYLVFIISCSVGIAFGLFSLILYLRIKGIFHIYTSIVSSFVFFPSLYLQYLILARKL
ncbi:transmembrane protein-like [Anaeramoeba ignava]|uniref:Transmembrane protein-like n=1 Tax=Anaeramoeba ignava TaxID=1746090 RepID=A0A9Q0M038_ANAIG|nr:transmembrane protein-like [Anaeramoeba ignava]